VPSNCPVETPEGQSIGVVKNISYMTHLTIPTNSASLYEYVEPYIVKVDDVPSKDLYNEVKEENLFVSGLINNAGFGEYGNFVEMPLKKDEEMIALNVMTLVGLTKLFGADMVKAGKGKIMNVASLLSFLPFPYYSVYSATKSFVLAFTETVSAELQGKGVTVTALCPGTVETPFHTNEMRKTNAMSANKPMPAKVVAKVGVELFLNGKSKKIVGFMNWFLSNLPRVTPDFIMMKIKKNLASVK
jgi:short-subunit dehydrogenase